MSRPTQPRVLSSRQEPNLRVLRVQIPPNLAYFEGHFRVAPIVPGVALTDWAIRYACEAFGLQPRVETLNNLKFHHVLQPDDEVELSLIHQPEKRTTSFRYASDERVFAAGRVVWRAP